MVSKQTRPWDYAELWNPNERIIYSIDSFHDKEVEYYIARDSDNKKLGDLYFDSGRFLVIHQDSTIVYQYQFSNEIFSFENDLKREYFLMEAKFALRKYIEEIMGV